MVSYTTDCGHLPSMKDVFLDWSKVGNQGSTPSLDYKEVDKCQSRLGTGEASVGVVPIQVRKKMLFEFCMKWQKSNECGATIF